MSFMMKLEIIPSGGDVVRQDLLAPRHCKARLTVPSSGEFHTDVGIDGQTAVETGVLICKSLCVEQTLCVP